MIRFPTCRNPRRSKGGREIHRKKTHNESLHTCENPTIRKRDQATGAGQLSQPLMDGINTCNITAEINRVNITTTV